MSNKRLAGVLGLLVAVGVVGPGAGSLWAGPGGDLSLNARLIWGTDGDKPSDPRLKDLDPKLNEKLTRVFKWKHYWEVNRESVSIPQTMTRKVRMSDKCELEIKNLGQSTIEVKLFGEGKFVKKVRQPMKAGECSVLAGDDKNDSAWFVVLSLKEH